MSRRRALLYSLVPVAALLVGVEVLLWVFGLGAEESGVDRGFDRDGGYVVPHPERDGWWVTQIFDGQPGEVAIPPRRPDVTRVLLFGGSNVDVFPDARLEARLNERAGEGRSFEVFNLGRSGYGSGRVAILVRQALVLQPDVVVVYAGHNEFIEAGFRLELDRRWSGWSRGWLAVVGRLRTYRLLARGLRGPVSAAPGSRGPAPATWRWEYAKFERTTYPETLERYAAYDRNLRSVCALCAQAGVRVVLSTVVANDLSAPFVSSLPPDLDEATVGRIRSLEASVDRELPDVLRPLLPDTDFESPGRARPSLRDWHQREDANPPDFVPPVLRPLGFPFEKGELWTDPGRWSSEITVFMQAVEAFHGDPVTAAERARLERVDALLTELLELCPDHPRALFVRGLCLLRSGGRDDEALAALTAAGRFDRAPLKAGAVPNEIVRAIAADLPQVAFVDAEARYRETTPGGILGFELLCDECHLHPGAKHLLTTLLVRAILSDEDDSDQTDEAPESPERDDLGEAR